MGLIPFLSPISIVKQIDHGLGNMSLVSPDKFQHILHVQNTNIDGTRNIMFAMTAIRGIGRRFSNLICKKADIDLSKRAGQLDDDEIRRMETIMQNPRLVLEQTKGLEGRPLWPVYLQRSRHQAP